jgi:predicted O-methyltransferase YrrM
MKVVNLDNLFSVFGKAPTDIGFKKTSKKHLKDYKMEEDDSEVLRYLYKTTNPLRHLEIGTWKGFGSKLVLENCRATVWSINLLEGEKNKAGGSAYEELPMMPRFSLSKLWQKIGKQKMSSDAGFRIGRLVHEAGLGHRFNQIFCDSRQWDISNYPRGFFDSVLIDGSHEPEMVVHDTRKTTPLLRSGGIMLWHDYCPDPEVIQTMSSVRGVTRGIEMLDAYLKEHFSECFWINPSWLLVGIKK